MPYKCVYVCVRACPLFSHGFPFDSLVVGTARSLVGSVRSLRLLYSFHQKSPCCDVRLETSIHAIKGKPDQPFEIICASRGTTETTSVESFDDVISTLPSHILADVLEASAPFGVCVRALETFCTCSMI